MVFFISDCSVRENAGEDIGIVIEKVKLQHQQLEKQLVISGDYKYNVKSTIAEYDILYDLDKAILLNEGMYQVPFAVVNNITRDKGGDYLIWEPEEDLTGVLLSLDDFYPSWNEYFYLFNDYDIKITFFVFGYYDARKTFSLNASSKGHEIGFHTYTHKDLTTLSPEQFDFEVFVCLDQMKADGINITSFAYPYGVWKEWMHEELLKKYHIVRGYDKFFHVYTIDELKRGGYFSSKSIDYNKYKSDKAFERDIRKMFILTKFLGDEKVIPITSHTISLTDKEWAIRPYHLEYIFKTGKEFKLKFYKFNDFIEIF
jgi:hypothetical protein